MGATAVALDGGGLYSERRHAQNGADHAALAAAFEECTGGSIADAQAAGLAAAAANGFDNAGITNTVQINREAPYRYRSIIDTTIDGSFSRIIGASDLDTGATAVASCTPGAIQGEALFANGTGCSEPELLIQGNNLTVNGGAHSNEDVKIEGEGHVVNGSFGYVDPPGTFIDTGSTNTYAETISTVRPYPIDFQITDYRPGGAVAAAAGAQFFDVSMMVVPGSWNATSQTWTVANASLPAGIYYSPGKIEVGAMVNALPASGGGTDGVTFVAEGKITFKDNATFTAWGHPLNQDLVVFSNHPGTDSCTEVAVELLGNTNLFNGIVLAKHGVARIQGNSTSALGGVWGFRVIVQANTFSVSGPVIGSGGDPELTFDE